MIMTLLEVLRKATLKDASDVFIIEGRLDYLCIFQS